MFIIDVFNKPSFNKTKMTRVIYTNNKPFKPSIKLEPFINISKQKEVKKILKTAFSSKLSKKFNLEDNIS